MKIYAKKIENRKILVERLVELTGLDATYTRMPRCAYEIGFFTIEKNGNLSVSDYAREAEKSILTILMNEELIGNEITSNASSSASASSASSSNVNSSSSEPELSKTSENIQTDPSESAETAKTTESTETTESAEIAETLDIGSVNEIVTTSELASTLSVASEVLKEEELTDQDASSTSVNTSNTSETAEPNELNEFNDPNNPNDPNPQEPMETAELQSIEATQNADTADVRAATSEFSEEFSKEPSKEPAVEAPEPETELPKLATGNVTVTEDVNYEAEASNPDIVINTRVSTSEELDSTEHSDKTSEFEQKISSKTASSKFSVPFPITEHTVNSIMNLVCMIYTRGSLLSKATGGNFGADKELIEVMLEDSFSNKDELIDFIKGQIEDGRRLDGLNFEDDKVTFDGFDAVQNPEKREVYSRFVERMNNMALKQKRIQAKEVDEKNEKYAFRIWLIRLGMNGIDYKLDRKILLQNLCGHSAFRTEADKEKWIAKQNAKKQALHDQKTSLSGTANSECEELTEEPTEELAEVLKTA